MNFVDKKGYALPLEVGTPPPPPGPNVLMRVPMTQATGDLLDTISGNAGTVSGSLERGLDTIAVGGSASIASDGINGYATFSHMTEYQNRLSDGSPITSWSVYLYVQPDTHPAVQYVLATKQNGPNAGGWSIELVPSGGNTHVRAFVRQANGSAVWIGTSSGFLAPAPLTAYRLALTYDAVAGVARLYIGDSPAVASQTIAGAALSNNAAPITLWSYTGGLAQADAVLTEFHMVDGLLDDAAIDALPAAVTISRPPPPTGGFSCANRATATLNTDHKDRGGPTTEQQLPIGGTNIKFDFTGTLLTNNYVGGGNYDPSYNVRMQNGNLSNSCMWGGAITKAYRDYFTSVADPNIIGGFKFRREYPSNHAGHILFRDVDCSDILIDGWRMHQGWDWVRTTKKNNPEDQVQENITMQQCWVTDTLDEVIENDQHMNGINMKDCLVERTFVLYSDTGGSNQRDSTGLSTIEDCLIWLYDMYAPPGVSGGYESYDNRNLFKLNSRATFFALYRNYWRIDAIRNADRHPFNNLLTSGGGATGKLTASADNVILWTGSGDYASQVDEIPPGFTYLNMPDSLTTWDNLAAAWKTNHPHVPRIPGIDP